MQPINLIGIDLDGTLVQDSTQVSERNIRAIRAAAERGVTVAIATGRPHVSAEQFVERLGLHDTPIISFNGAMVRKPGGSEPMLLRPVAPDLAVQVVQFCVDRRLHIHYYLGDTMYVTRNSYWARLYGSRTGLPSITAGDMRRFDGQAPIKILVCLPPDDVPALLAEGQQTFGDHLYVTRSMPEYVEFMSRDAGKGKALQWLAAHLGIPADQTMGMGDMLNDLELVELCGFGVAMPHAQDPVKAAAQYVAKSGPEGVGEAIEKFVLAP